MFKPGRAPKEGRSPPGLPFTMPSSTSRARFTHRSTVTVIMLFMFLAMVFFILGPDADKVGLRETSYSSRARNWDFAMREVRTGVGSAIEDVHDDSPRAENAPDLHPESPANNRPSQEENQAVAEHSQRTIVSGHASAADSKSDLSDGYESGREPTLNERWKTIAQKKLAQQEHISPLPEPPVGNGPARDIGTHVENNKQEIRKGATNEESPRWPKRPGFESALGRVLSMLPDEVHMRELTRSIDGTGKERLREFGLRTRAYRKYFEAWENLHLSPDSEDSVYVRDDVIQYLRSRYREGDRILGNIGDGNEGDIGQIVRGYESYRNFLTSLADLLFPWTAPWFGDHMSLHAHFKRGGRGIVLTAGDDQAPFLLTTIWSFRKLGCTLPIEIMYLGDQDLGEDYRQELEALPGVVTRDIAQMTNDEGWRLQGWAAKPFAVLLSSFREVIFIDADSLFLKNPSVLFDDLDYMRTGALFFKDRLIMPENKKRWMQQILPKPIPKAARQSRFWTGESGHMQESGVLVIDKWKHFIALLLVTRMNGPDRDGNTDQGKIGVYDMVYGDKETFWLGWLLAGDEDFAFHRGDAGVMGKVQEPVEDEHKDKPEKREKKRKPERHKKRDDPEGQQSEVIPQSTGNNDGDTTLESTADQNIPTEAPEALPPLEVPHGPENYTICSPQLLHLDQDGNPLWFNGWLLDNKFSERSKQKFVDFEEYLIEPHDIREPGAWQLGDSNRCCLTSDADKHFLLSKEDKATLRMIMDRAAEVSMGSH